MIKLMVGLGNPGPQYINTRHNAGFWFIDSLARQLNAHLNDERAYQGRMVRVTAPGTAGHLWLLQPQTFMNLSGRSVAALAHFYKIEPSQILVIHDELDLPPGHMKAKQGGGHAGHNGLKDILSQLGTPDFWRLRLGIGHPGVKAEVADYVLRKPPLAERQAIEDAIQRSLRALDALWSGDMEQVRRVIHQPPASPRSGPATQC